MTVKNVKSYIVRDINLLDLVGIVLVLIAAFVVQFSTGELPCPLCLLQRVGLFFIAFGLLMNINGRGSALRNYGVSGLGAMFMGMAALRQMLLHIVPGSGAYGQPIFGLHLYTWSLIISSLFLLSIFVLMLFNVDVDLFKAQVGRQPRLRLLIKGVTLVYLALALFSSITAFMECGFLFCPDNPVRYQYVNQKSTFSTSAQGGVVLQSIQGSGILLGSKVIDGDNRIRV